MALLGRIARSLDRSTPKGRVARRITWVCATVCFAVMTLAISIQRGFEQSITERIGLLGGDMMLEPQPWGGYSATDTIPTAALRQIEGVEQSMVVEEQSAVAQTGETIRGVLLRRAAPREICQWLEDVWIEQPNPTIWHGSNDDLPLAISATLARRLSITIGQTVDLLLFSDSLTLPYKTHGRVAGIYSTAIESAEEPIIFAASPTTTPTGYLLRGPSIDREALDELGSSYGWDSSSIDQRAPELFDWLSMLQNNMILVVIVILVVGLVNLAGSVLIFILEGTTTIALLSALGLRQANIQQMFLWRSLSVVIQGALWGVGVGVVLATVQHYGRLIRLNAADYFVDTLPMAMVPMEWAMLAAGALVLIGGVVWATTYILGRIHPASALTYE